jgi:hypothetical protein
MEKKRMTTLTLTTIALLCLGLALSAGDAGAQQKSLKQQLTGTWMLVSIAQTAKDGTKPQLFGPNPKGVQIFDASGQWAQILVRPDRPKFKVNNRLEGTPEENKTAVQGTSATFGTWSVDEASKTLTVHYEGSLFPNQVGTDAKRTVSVTGDELKVSNPATASGLKSDTVWKRAK